MKALTVNAPWAHLIATGRKRFELRKKPTKHRGSLAIHAGLKASKSVAFAPDSEIEAALAAPRGVVICVVDVVDCYPVSSTHAGAASEGGCCEVEPTEYVWVLENPRRLTSPPKVRGQQGFFWVDLDVETP